MHRLSTNQIYSINAILFGQYSAYSSHVHPVFVQHSDVIELPLPVMRRRLRLVRNIVLADSSSSQGNVTVQKKQTIKTLTIHKSMCGIVN